MRMTIDRPKRRSVYRPRRILPSGQRALCGVSFHYPNLWWGRMPLMEDNAVYRPPPTFLAGKMLNTLPQFQCDLSRTFGRLASTVPDGPPGDGRFVFHHQVLPVPPSSLSTDRIVIRKDHHIYNDCYRADGLQMCLSPRTCRELGLFLLACGFHGPMETTTLTLSHPESEIRRIVIETDPVTLDDPPSGLSMKPFALVYVVAEREKHPWVHDCCTHDLPLFALTNADNSIVGTDDDWRNRDTVWITRFSRGEFRFAELLLDAGCSWNPIREYELEGDAGFRGVAPMSAELRIFLPGSFGWHWNEDEIPAPDIAS
jgi:hypothetical protein